MSDLKKMIRTYEKAGFIRGDVQQRFRYRVWQQGVELWLIVNTKEKTATIYRYDSKGNYITYESQTIEKQAWSRIPCKSSHYTNVGGIRVDRQDRTQLDVSEWAS